MSTEAKRLLTTLATLILTALIATAPAQATDADTPPPSAGERIANALRTSPVYVDQAYADAVPPPRQRQLAAQIKKTDLPIKIVLTPLTKGDAFNGDSDVLAAVIRDRLPRRELILLTTDSDFTDSLNGYEWPSDTHQTRDAAAAVGLMDETRHAGLADLTAKAVELVAEGKGTEAYEQAVRDLDAEAAPSRKAPARAGNPSSTAPNWWLWPLIAVPALALTAVTARALLRRPRTPSVPQVVFATSRKADERALRRRAEAEVLALGEATRSADPATADVDLQKALDAYTAAGTVLDAARGIPDLAGVLALTAEGHDALTPGESLPLCFFNPLHGRATTRTTWRPLGRRDHLHVAACAQCTESVRLRRAPEVLTDRTADGRTVPYFELPAERSVWAATGYGSLVRGETEGIAARVARGDFSRSGSRPWRTAQARRRS
ncbi:hypothetical protein GCM10027074_51010 [Streptomyces deserti]